MKGQQYAFGDTQLARERLDLVADVFAAPSATFLREQVDFRPGLALDLGCGPGRTTRLVADVTGAAKVVGLDELTRSSATGEIVWGLRQVAYERAP